jgi:SAM-dependent methyltransferase
MMIHRSVAVAALSTVAFCLGWGVHTLISRDLSQPQTVAASVRPQPSSSADAPSEEEVFTEIYRTAKWGTYGRDGGTSGFGSSLQATVVYRTFLEHFMRDFAVRSVVDAGCGDWESTQAIDWTGIDYKGFDIVGSVIERDKGQFGKANVQFFQANIVDADLPPADLLICKQVLQHLPNAEVQRFLAKLGGYKHVLLIDSVDPISLSAKNVDIAAGDFRLLDLTRPPFNVRGEKLLTYWDGGSMEQVIHMKD